MLTFAHIFLRKEIHMERRYTLSEFAELINVHPKTLQRLDRNSVLVASRTITNRRYYTDEHLYMYYKYKQYKSI